MTQVLGTPRVQYFKSNTADFLASGKVYTYEAGTTTPKATYPTIDDADNETNANANPVILDARGEADIVLKGSTKITLHDENDNLIWTVDNLDVSSSDVLDIAGNELLTFNAVANAVNETTVTNAASGSAPTWEATGDDTNIGINLGAQASGSVSFINGDVEVVLGDFNMTSGNLTLNSGDCNITSGDLVLNDGELDLVTNTPGFSLMPAGVMTWFGGSVVPSRWLECDGSAISRTTYASLFAAIGTAFGVGDGSTTFNLPNQERSVLVGKDGTGTGTLGNAIGDTGGAETHTLTEAEMPSHDHEVWAGCQVARTTSAGSVDNYSGSIDEYNATSESTGGGTAHNIMQPSLVAMLIIRAY